MWEKRVRIYSTPGVHNNFPYLKPIIHTKQAILWFAALMTPFSTVFLHNFSSQSLAFSFFILLPVFLVKILIRHPTFSKGAELWIIQWNILFILIFYIKIKKVKSMRNIILPLGDANMEINYSGHYHKKKNGLFIYLITWRILLDSWEVCNI